ncbi:MAG: hypothetical protein QM736_12890 [Vicinamibacterales bacterium]
MQLARHFRPLFLARRLQPRGELPHLVLRLAQPPLALDPMRDVARDCLDADDVPGAVEDGDAEVFGPHDGAVGVQPSEGGRGRRRRDLIRRQRDLVRVIRMDTAADRA